MIIDWNAVEKEAVNILSKYLQINTVNPPGNETEGAEFLQEILKKEGIESDIYESQVTVLPTANGFQAAITVGLKSKTIRALLL